MKQDLITIENQGIILQRTNYFDTQQAQAGEFYLTADKSSPLYNQPAINEPSLLFCKTKIKLIKETLRKTKS